jgi:hypothetical protein
VNLNVLREIKERYSNIKEIFKTYKKSTKGTLSSDEVRKTQNMIEDLFVVEVFSCFERFLRDSIKNCLHFEFCFFGKQEIINHIEYLKIEDILNALKKESIIDPNSIGYVKQLKQYRDWVAHGRNPQKPPPIKTVDFDKVFEIIETIMEQMEKRGQS